MSLNRLNALLVAVAVLLSLRAEAQGTAFFYQGQLAASNTATTGLYDLRAQIYDANTNGNPFGPILTNNPIGVTNGYFSTAFDFGTNVFLGPARWLDLAVRPSGSTNAYTELIPRQALLAVPYAVFAGSASNLVGTLSASQLTGTLSASQLTGNYTNAVNFSSVSNNFGGSFTGTFTGNGNLLTNLNGSNIAVGTVADARLSTNVAFLNGNQTFSGANTFSNWNNSFTGSFYGNGLVGWNPVPSNTLNAVVDHGYVLTNALLTTVYLPSANVGDIIRLAGSGAGGWRVQCTNGQSVIGNFYNVGGTLWNGPAIGSGNWQALACSSDASRWIAGDNLSSGTIAVAQNYGASVSSQGTISTYRAVACSADASHLFAAVNGGYVYTNNGTTWAATSAGPRAWYSLACSANGMVVVGAVNNGYLYWSTNGGSTWFTPANSQLWQCVSCSASGVNQVAAVNSGSIYYSTNTGSTWTAATAPSAAWTAIALAANGFNGVAAVSGGYVYTTTNSGVSWSSRSNTPATTWTGVAASADGSKLAAVASSGSIYFSANQGATWTTLTESPTTNWLSVAISADGTRLVAGTSGSSTTGGIYYSSATTSSAMVTTTNGIAGSQGSSVELQCVGTGQFMPVSSSGFIWAN